MSFTALAMSLEQPQSSEHRRTPSGHVDFMAEYKPTELHQEDSGRGNHKQAGPPCSKVPLSAERCCMCKFETDRLAHWLGVGARRSCAR